MGNAPIKQIDVGRGVRASIWENQSKNGPLLSVTVTRSYHDGEEFKNTHSMGIDDCLFFSRASDLAFVWCLRHKEAMKVQAAKQE